MAAHLDSMAWQETDAAGAGMPWHGGGERVGFSEVLTPSQFMVRAGCDWPVFKRPALYTHGDGSTVEIPDCFAVGRIKDGIEEVWGTVGARHEVLPNATAFDWFAPFVESGEAQIHTAGALKGGRVVWALARINRDPIEVVKGDYVEKFLKLSHAHDGSLAVRLGFTPTRIVCWNTLQAAINDEASKLIRLKHTKRMLATMDVVRETIKLADATFEATAAQYKFLAGKSAANKDDVRRFVLEVLAEGSANADPSKPSTRMANEADGIVTKFLAGTVRGADLAGQTWWGAYNAVTEYLSWDRGSVDPDNEKATKTADEARDNRYMSLWFGSETSKGSAAHMNSYALARALQFATAS